MKLLTLHITTRNRLEDLKISLIKNATFIADERVHTLICVDGSEDDTYDYLKNNFPNVDIIFNHKSEGYIKCRNRMMSLTKTPYVVSLDDDAHFLSDNNVDSILNYFSLHPGCAVIAFRIYWGKNEMQFVKDDEYPQRVRGFVGCGHAWRLEHWKRIRPYPEWFVFYGEEEFAGYELFKQRFEIHYVPELFIQHRVDINSRKKDTDYLIRNRSAIRAGWYLWLIFVPVQYIPRYWMYSIYTQVKQKVLKGNPIILIAMLLAFIDILINTKKIINIKNRLTKAEYLTYKSLVSQKIYWKP